MIEATGIEKRYGDRRVLDGVDLSLPRGAVTLLVGTNGAGKTTLLRIACGLCVPDRGRLRVAGFDIVAQRLAALSQLAFFPQSPRFHLRLTCRQVARYYAQLRGLAPVSADAALERWGLGGHLTAATADLSGGLRQRLALAVFSLAPVPVLVLDEPGLSLDPEWRTRLQEHLSAAAAQGATVLVATHLLGEWEGKTDQCVLLEAGRVGGFVAPERLREHFNAPERSVLP